MLERFYPNEYLDSVYDIDFEMYYKQGIRGIISDIDNTLVPHGAPATEEIVALFDKIHKLGIDTCLISDNQEPRVEPFAYAVKSKYIFDAHKPSTKNYRKAMELMGKDCGPLRMPLTELSPEHTKALAQAMKGFGIELA